MATSTVSVELPEYQIISIVEQLSSAAKQEILKRLILDYDQWNAMVDVGEQRMRELAAERGLDWESLDEDARHTLIDTILHED
jgi:hypothetical protein